MAFWKKTFPFLLLNIVVSAATMLLVLWLWQEQGPLLATKPTFTPAVTLANAFSQATPEEPAVTTADPSDGLLSMEGVFGAGDLNVEYVLIRNQSDSSVNLNGWTVTSSAGKSFSFPQLTLNASGAVRLYSKHGTNQTRHSGLRAARFFYSINPGSSKPAGRFHNIYCRENYVTSILSRLAPRPLG